MGQSSDLYNKKESDSRFAPAQALNNYYTKFESDTRFAPAPALTNINNTIGGLQGVFDNRYASASTIGGLQGVFDKRYASASALTNINNTIGGLQGVFDTRYAAASNVYNKTDSDGRYVQGSTINDLLSKGMLLDKSALTNYYNKTDSNNRFAPASALTNYYNKTDSNNRFAPASALTRFASDLSDNVAKLKFMSAKERSLAPAGASGSFTSCMSNNTLNVNGFEDQTKNLAGASFVTCDNTFTWTMTFDFKRLDRDTGFVNIIQKYTSAPRRSDTPCEQRTPVISVTNGESLNFRYSYGNNSINAQCGTGAIPNVNLPWDKDWHNIIWQQRGRNIQIYLDGRPVVNVTLPADPVPFDSTRDMILGSENFISIKNFNYVPGYLLSGNEIAAIAFNRNF